MISRAVTLILACSLATTLQAQDARSLIAQADTAYMHGKYAESANLYVRAITAGATNAFAYYNAACCFALAGSKDTAFYYLGRSIESGWNDADHMQQDSDLASLRPDPRWNACVDKTKSNKAKIPPKDFMINDMNNLAAFAYQYRIRPKSMGGGDGSYVGFVLPAQLTSNANGKYSTAVVSADTVEFQGVTLDGKSGVTVRIGEKGMLHAWIYKGDFK
jgi:hypothetical protein